MQSHPHISTQKFLLPYYTNGTGLYLWLSQAIYKKNTLQLSAAAMPSQSQTLTKVLKLSRNVRIRELLITEFCCQINYAKWRDSTVDRVELIMETKCLKFSSHSSRFNVRWNFKHWRVLLYIFCVLICYWKNCMILNYRMFIEFGVIL